ncbi:uncharacterized protein ATC70_009519 [Mucor velutinosus]|uniref:Uncharacterized protein n=1 Tax=Mucor velutinosus TaxID=708070 RepID=A0AAN7DKV4_9FUNG|nr:hypothetical protein ATC70_009519 [Mucor velutinosus]
MNPSLKDEYEFVVSIDFGTTYSSCCYASVRDPETVYSVKNWPRASILDEKIPSVIVYSGTTNCHDSDTSVIPSVIAYTLTKQQSSIDIDSQIVGFGNVPETSTSIRIKHLPFILHIKDLEPDESNRNPAADYLNLFHQHVIRKIAEQHGEKGIQRIRYCFTLQHPEQPRYKLNLIKAVKLAGIYIDQDIDEKVLFINTYTAMAKHFLKKHSLRLDTKFMICDADSKYLKLKIMRVVSTGRNADIEQLEHDLTSDYLCSDRLNELFEDYVLDIIRQHPTYTEDKEAAMKKTALKYFKEKLKFSLDLQADRKVNILLSPAISKKPAPYLALDMKDLKHKVYDPIVDGICKHVAEEQKTHATDYVFLCGTLSTLEYVKQRLDAITNNVIVVSNDDLSAAHGAVYYGLNKKLGVPRNAPICIETETSRLAEDDTMHNKEEDDYTHIIGIDFGTSFSKWYYSKYGSSEQVEFDKATMQLPTLSLYDESLSQQKYWGKEAFDDYYKSGESGKLMSRFKLFLDEVSKDDENEQLVIDAISNYLRALNGKIKETMESLFPDTPKRYRYCFTVPTIWSDKMKQVMRDTVTCAGIVSKEDPPSRLLLVNEPEAAAIFYANDPKTDFFNTYFEMNPEKTIVRTLICDAGGGTVDMATYEHSRKDQSSKYYIEEITAGTGSLCGSSFLDDAFRKYIQKECYDQDYNVSNYEREQMVLHFILNIKENYTYKNQQDTIIDVPNKKGDKIVIPATDMSTKIFDPIVDQILSLIENQYKAMQKVEKKLDMIVLTGGLGQSEYLRNKIQDTFHDKNIQVQAPVQYDQSVVRGAVELAKDTSYITKRIVRKSYGIQVMTPLADASDLMDPSSEPTFAKYKLDTLFRANHFMKNHEYIEKKYYVTYPHNTFITVFSFSDAYLRIDSTLDPRLDQVLKRNIDMPNIPSLQAGDAVPIIIRLYLGQTEVKLQVVLDEKTTNKIPLRSIIKTPGKQELPPLPLPPPPPQQQQQQQQQQQKQPLPLPPTHQKAYGPTPKKSLSSKLIPQKSFNKALEKVNGSKSE